MICTECGLPFIPFLNPYIVVTPANIKFGEILCSFEFIDKLGDEGERIMILHRYCIQPTIILYQAQFSVFLLDKEER
ncbi:hypothetical protein PAXRUDRAFT_145523 [Paxillus rubicundulus Ve08.2h10]|uniref:Uncharacterized protein n=1 Tax=Paxillus rubicundulus Ve08.2h10 TaxID=930991 RepID=A0A0D0E0E2_9AGAM|nr:hypothetical protein PAXRUDRAFT_145523 [Paxillus rubicundulus Ve08.2h10]